MSQDAPSLSRSVEDYLKVIYGLTEEGGAASTSQVASALDVQPASVSGMVKRLAESGLVEHVPYRGVRLTPGGLREALRVVRRHRILETYLSQRLGCSWDDVHAEAERLEHAASDELIERMASALEHPRHDPHGAPIPTRTGAVEETGHPTLAEVAAGRLVVVRAVKDDDRERLQYMEARGLVPGAVVYVEARAPFDGPITLRVREDGSAPETIGLELAAQIRVSYSE